MTLPLGFTVSLPSARVIYSLLICALVLISLLVRFPALSREVASYVIVRQDRIDHGVLIRWTKGFGAPNTEGYDVVAMFRKSLEKFVGRW